MEHDIGSNIKRDIGRHIDHDIDDGRAAILTMISTGIFTVISTVI